MGFNVTKIEMSDNYLYVQLWDKIVFKCDLVMFLCDASKPKSFKELDRVIDSFIVREPLLVILNKRNKDNDLTHSDIFKQQYASLTICEMDLMKEDIKSKNGINLMNLTKKLLSNADNSQIKLYRSIAYKANDTFIQYEHSYKVILIGNSSVGKTAMTNKFKLDLYKEIMASSVGINTVKRYYTIDDHIFELDVWDTSGQERYKKMPHSYYHKVDGFMILFDLTSRKSFEETASLAEQIRGNNNKPSDLIFLIGNKADLIDQRAVSSFEAQSLAEQIKVQYYETSCRYGFNVLEVFSIMIEKLHLNYIASNIKYTSPLTIGYNCKNRKVIGNQRTEGCCS